MATKSKKGTKAKQETLQEPVLTPIPAGTTPEPEKAAEGAETPKDDPVYVPLPKSPEEIIHERYGFGPDQTNIPKLLYALLCEAVSR
jgi:hypothetical protein